MRRQLKADLSLVLVTMGWGVSFIFLKELSQVLHPMMVIFIRFLIAALTLLIIAYFKKDAFDQRTWSYGVLSGLVLFLAFAFLTYGIASTTPSKSAFIAALSVVLVPVIMSAKNKRLPAWNVCVSVLMSLIGLALLTGVGNDSSIVVGDYLTLGCALMYAIFIIQVEQMVKKVSPWNLVVVQMFTVSFLALALAIILGETSINLSSNDWMMIVFLGLICTGMAFGIQNVAQKYTSATHTAVIFVLEPLFASVLAFMLLGEQLGVVGWFGAILIIGSMIMVEK